MSKVFVLTNHGITEDQIRDLKDNWMVSEIEEPSSSLKEIWGSIPPEAEHVSEYVQPVIDWLEANLAADDFVWVQGEWGATVTILTWCSQNKATAIYSTTGRIATETKTDNGTLMTHVFKHVRFRKFPI